MRSQNGQAWGAAILVAPRDAGMHALTCAHVVDAAQRSAGGGTVTIELPGRDWQVEVAPVAAATSAPPTWGDRVGEVTGADFAVLAPVSGHPPLPRGHGPLRPAVCGTTTGRAVAIVGYPRGAPAGIIATAALTGTGGPCPEWVQLDGLRTTGPAVEHGFSGAAVWDPELEAVIGLVTAAHTDRTAKVAWMLPMEAAARHWHPLKAALRSAEVTSQREEETWDVRFRVADRLLEVPQIAYDSGRSLRAALPAPIRRNVFDHAFPRQQLAAVVAACLDHPDGRRVLRRAVLEIGGETVTVRHALRALDGEAAGDEG
ncbi:trypsin-like peptidase domain-containing protein [Streptomyces sp. NPDC086080]|uniref:effector-associated domain 2-containing protein n=1 Tax=Streptomyces sp. NPDC086080 TaxID=3365748 RepID=UPI0037D59E9D